MCSQFCICFNVVYVCFFSGFLFLVWGQFGKHQAAFRAIYVGRGCADMRRFEQQQGSGRHVVPDFAYIVRRASNKSHVGTQVFSAVHLRVKG